MKDLINILTEKLLKDKAISSLKYVNEIKVRPPNPLNQLLDLQSKILASNDPQEKRTLAIKCAEQVLYIWEEKYPNDKRPRKAIEAAKVYLANSTEENQKAAFGAAMAADAAAYADEDDEDEYADPDAAAYAANSAALAAYCDFDANIAASAAAATAVRAVKKYYNLNEIKVNKPNPLNYLLDLQSRIKASHQDYKEKLSLAIKCAERVLFIWEEKFPDSKRPRQAIEAAKACLANPTKKNRKVAKVAGKAALDAVTNAAYAANDNAAYAAAAYAAAYAASAADDASTDDDNGYAAANAAADAIKAVKAYYNLNEIKVRPPNPLNQLLSLQSEIETTNDHKKRLSLYIQCAEKVLFIFEEKYPDDNRPRKAIDAAKAYLVNPTEKNKNAANDAGGAALDATYAINNEEAFIINDYSATDAAAFTAIQAAWSTDDDSSEEYAVEYAIQAVKKYYNLNEIKVNKPNPLNYLLSLQSKIKASKDPKEQLSLAIQCAEKVLFIWEEKYLNDKRPRQAIDAAKAYLDNPTEENKEVLDDAARATADYARGVIGDDELATRTAAASAYYAATNDADYTAKLAIEAVKEHYNLNEIKVNKPTSPSSPISDEIKEQIKDKIISFITEEMIYQFRPEQIVYYFLINAPDIFESFIIDQMVFNNYEVFKNGEEILLSYNNQNIIDEQDIIDYINTKPNLQEYLSKILKEFYLENVEVDTIYKNVLKLVQKNYADDEYALKDKRINDYFLSHWIKDNADYTDLEDIIYINLVYFKQFLEKKFLNTDLINEIKVRPPSPINQLLDLQSKINASNDPQEKRTLAIKCAEKVLYIWEERYPNNKLPYQAIEAAKVYLANSTEENQKAAIAAADDANAAAANTTYSTAYHAANSAALAAYAANAAYAADAAEYAIIAFKEHYNLNEPINEIKSNIPANLKEAIKSLTEYMINQDMDIKPLPKLKLINNDSKNASNILGKTAHYDPNDCSITLYTMNRLPKDILRSYAHEMIHRMQDNEGRLQNIHTTNTNEGGELEELEKEAYLKGNICLRNWEDEIKNASINENEEPTFSNTNVENEWELKILNDLTAEKLKEMLLNPKYSEGSFVIQGEGLKDILQQTFGFPNTPSNIKKNEELFKTKTKYLYNDISNKVGKFKPSQLDIIKDKDGKLLFMFLKNNKDNQTLVKDYYEQISKKSLQSDLNPEIINSTTIRFPLSDTANLNKILDNLQKAKILTNEDYTLKKQPKLQ